MLHIHAGQYSGLTAAQQKAVTDLTVKRYVEDYLYLTDFLHTELSLKHGSISFIQEYKKWYHRVEDSFSKYDENTFIVAIFLQTDQEECIPLAAFRTVRGTNENAPIVKTIGDMNSSIPMHRLLQSFSYTSQGSFDPNSIMESDICEFSRRATVKAEEIYHLVQTGKMSEVDAAHFLKHKISHLFLGTFKHCMNDLKACVLNLRLFHAHTIIHNGINLKPLFTEGVEPTEFAINQQENVLAPIFSRWSRELNKFVSKPVQTNEIASIIKELSKGDLHNWQYCNVPLPFLIVVDDELVYTINCLEKILNNESQFFKYHIAA